MRETVIREDDGPPQPALDSTEDYLIQLLVQQSVIDSKDFDVLTLEQVEELKKVGKDEAPSLFCFLWSLNTLYL
jgi:hypothetical protein